MGVTRLPCLRILETGCYFGFQSRTPLSSTLASHPSSRRNAIGLHGIPSLVALTPVIER